MKNRIIALLLAVCLLVSAVPMQVGAAETASITVNDGSTYAGSRVSVSISAANFESVASLDLYIYYDSDVMSVYRTTNGGLFSESQVSINTSEAGVIKLSAIDLAGISGSGTLLTVRFQINEDCAVGDYPINVVVGDSYDVSLNEVAISDGSGTLTVQQSQSGAETFSIYGYPDTTLLTQGDLLTVNVANTSWTEFASADFVVEYDAELFELDSVTMESALTIDDAVYSINTSIAGVVRISYASNTPVQTYNLFSVKLKVIGDVDTTTTITTKALNVYQEDLTAYLPSEDYCTITLQKQPEVIDHPDISLETQQLIVGQQSSSVLTLEADAEVAAADFTLTYDPTVLSCISVTTAEGLSDLGGMLVLNDNYSEGAIKFSYINMNGYSESDIPLIVITWEPLQSPDAHYQISISGAGVVDTEYQKITLEYVTDTGCIYAPTVTAPGCVDEGYTTYACTCGDSYTQDYVDPVGHSYENDIFNCDNCDHVRTAVSVSVETLPTKTEYIERAEALDVSGGVLSVTLDDGETVLVDMTEDMISNFDNTVIGTQTLTVSLGGQEATFDVTVTAIEIDRIEVVNPSKLTYLEGEQLEVSDGFVKIHYKVDNAYTVQIPLTAEMVSGYDPDKTGDQTLTVTYEGYTAEFVVSVTAKSLNAIEISQLPEKLEYFGKKDTLDVSGGMIMLHYNNGTSQQIPMSADMISGFDNTQAGVQTLTVTYQGKTAEFDVEIVTATVIFLDWDGSVISTGQYMYGEEVTIPTDPFREADETYIYCFTGWDQTVTACQGDVTYTAQYTCEYISYLVEFYDWDGTLISAKTYHYGDEIEVPEDPVRESDETYTYTFAGWGMDSAVCQYNAVYTASYTSTFIDYTVTFVDWDGSVISSATYHYGDIIAAPADPYRMEDETGWYSFVGWDRAVSTCQGDMTFTAVYVCEYFEYLVQFCNWDGSLLAVGMYHYGDSVEIPADPTRAADETYTYTFAGWDSSVENCYGNTVYTATYTSTYIDYTVVFKDWDGSVISSATYHYGDAVEVPEDPTRAADETYTYTFTGWDSSVENCYGNTVYTATYTQTEITVTSIAITSNPNKLSYLEGEEFDPTGMIITAYFSTGISAEVTDYTVTGYDPTPGTKTITVTYKGQSVSFTVTVSSRVPDQITSDVYTIEDGVILYVLPHITVSQLLADLNEGEYIRVFDGDVELTGDDQVTGTMTLKLMDGDTVKDTATVLLMGDVNHDCNVDNLDATLVLQYAAGWDVTLDLTAADVCSDGNVDNLDATLILQYAAGWNVTFEVGIAG